MLHHIVGFKYQSFWVDVVTNIVPYVSKLLKVSSYEQSKINVKATLESLSQLSNE